SYTKNGSQISKFLKKLNKPVVLGYTATPVVTEAYAGVGVDPTRFYSQLNMLDQTRFPSLFKNIIHVSPIQEMIEKGYHTPLRFTCFDIDRSCIKFNGTDFSPTSASEYLQTNKKLQLAAQIIKESL